LRLPTRHAEAISMTLPHLLTKALRVKTKSNDARYVYQLEQWILARPGDSDMLIITLSTPDGFQTSFAIPYAIAEVLGFALRDATTQTTNLKPAPKLSRTQLN